MSLAKTVTKMFPTPNTLGINLIVTDDDRPDLGPGERVVINKTISRNYVKGQDMPVKIATEIGNEAQTLINSYKNLKSDYDKEAYQTKVTQIDNALTL